MASTSLRSPAYSKRHQSFDGCIASDLRQENIDSSLGNVFRGGIAVSVGELGPEGRHYVRKRAASSGSVGGSEVSGDDMTS
jgi:hypothetical protein